MALSTAALLFLASCSAASPQPGISVSPLHPSARVAPGEAWTSVSSGTRNSPYSVYFANVHTGWVVGDHGMVLKTSDGGASWRREPSGTTEPLYSVWFVNTKVGWAVGGDNVPAAGISVILKTTDGGATWTSQLPATSAPLEAVDFVNAHRGWAVGGLFSGVILTTNDGGTTWKVQRREPYLRFTSVCFVDTHNGWVLLDDSTILKTTDGGATWVRESPMPMSPMAPAALTSMQFINTHTGWVVGGPYSHRSAAILKTTDGGVTWSRQHSNARSLNSVYFVDTTHGWAVGGDPYRPANPHVLLRTVDGGLSWWPQDPGVHRVTLDSVFALGPNTAYAVGYRTGAGGVATSGALLRTLVRGGGQ